MELVEIRAHEKRQTYLNKNNPKIDTLRVLTNIFLGVQRPYSPEEVVALRTSLKIEHSIAKFGAENLWQLLHSEPYVATFGAMTGAQAVQMVKAGVKSVYLSGWQVAADANLSSQTYPDQSLYPSNSVPQLIRRLNNAMMRGDEIDR